MTIEYWGEPMALLPNAEACLRKRYALAVFLLATFSTLARPAVAQSAAFIVGNDRGGVIGTRAEEVLRLKAENRRVEMRGGICLSSCTIYLGAGNVCVSPETRFGFHGPSYYGQPLLPVHFEYWSEVLASHFPLAVRQWFFDRARHRTNGYHTVLGKELIRHGVAACE